MKKTNTKRTSTRQKRLEGNEHFGIDTPENVQGGSAGGALNEKIAVRDDAKRTFERPAGVTRVRKSDERS